MTLGEIKSNALKIMGVYSDNIGDDNPSQEFEPMMTTFINQGYALICEEYKPIQDIELITDMNGLIPVAMLKGYQSVVDLWVVDDYGKKTKTKWAITECRQFIRLCASVHPARALLVYTYMPDELRNDTDIPVFEPRNYHSALVSYAVYCLMSMHTLGDSKTAGIYFSQYQMIKEKIRPQQGFPSTIRNKYVPLG